MSSFSKFSAKINKTKFCESQISHQYLHRYLQKAVRKIYIHNLHTYSESDEKVLPFLFPQVASIKREGPVEKGEQIYHKQREHEHWLGMKHNGRFDKIQ